MCFSQASLGSRNTDISIYAGIADYRCNKSSYWDDGRHNCVRDDVLLATPSAVPGDCGVSFHILIFCFLVGQVILFDLSCRPDGFVQTVVTLLIGRGLAFTCVSL